MEFRDNRNWYPWGAFFLILALIVILSDFTFIPLWSVLLALALIGVWSMSRKHLLLRRASQLFLIVWAVLLVGSLIIRMLAGFGLITIEQSNESLRESPQHQVLIVPHPLDAAQREEYRGIARAGLAWVEIDSRITEASLRVETGDALLRRIFRRQIDYASAAKAAAREFIAARSLMHEARRLIHASSPLPPGNALTADRKILQRRLRSVSAHVDTQARWLEGMARAATRLKRSDPHALKALLIAAADYQDTHWTYEQARYSSGVASHWEDYVGTPIVALEDASALLAQVPRTQWHARLAYLRGGDINAAFMAAHDTANKINGDIHSLLAAARQAMEDHLTHAMSDSGRNGGQQAPVTISGGVDTIVLGESEKMLKLHTISQILVVALDHVIFDKRERWMQEFQWDPHRHETIRKQFAAFRRKRLEYARTRFRTIKRMAAAPDG